MDILMTKSDHMTVLVDLVKKKFMLVGVYMQVVPL